MFKNWLKNRTCPISWKGRSYEKLDKNGEHLKGSQAIVYAKHTSGARAVDMKTLDIYLMIVYESTIRFGKVIFYSTGFSD